LIPGKISHLLILNKFTHLFTHQTRADKKFRQGGGSKWYGIFVDPQTRELINDEKFDDQMN
jgi:hypothetical protein